MKDCHIFFNGETESCSRLENGICRLMVNEAWFDGKVEMLPIALTRLSDDQLEWLRVNHVPNSVGASPIQECAISDRIYEIATNILKLRGYQVSF